MKSIIIVTYNSTLYIQECLESIEKNISEKDQVFVIDNASDDDTEKKILEFIENKNNFKFIKQNFNYGFAKAVNIGLKMSIGEYIFLINPDVKFEMRTLDEIIESAQKNSADIVGIKQIDKNGKPLGSFGKFPTKLVNFFETIWLAKIFPVGRYVRHNFLTKKIFNSVQKVDWVGGGFILIKKKVVEEIGIFDEKFFMYFEDVDFCLRAKKASFSVWFAGNIEVLHYGGRSFSKKNNLREQHNKESLRYFMKKHNL